MNRTLTRPMFRIGGSAEGITSGLAPRQGYKKNGSVKQNDFRSQKISDVLSGATTIGEAQDLARAMAYKPRGTNVYDFMTEMGLDLVSRPAAGGIFQQLATSAKEPYAKYMEGKKSAAEQEYASESDMFKTFLTSAAAATGEEGLAGKTAQWKSEMVPKYLNTIATIGAKPEDERSFQEKIDLEAATINLDNLKEDNPLIKFFLDNKKLGEALIKKIKPMLLTEDQKLPEGERKYDPELGEDDPQLIIDTFLEFKKQVLEMSKAEGGRIGYQIGGDVMPGAMPTGQAAMPTNQEAMPTDQAAPEDMGAITYEELRARLPQEISDDIVRLLANSAEALEDFAMIQTEQDINNFNRKYGVTLVLPAEG